MLVQQESQLKYSITGYDEHSLWIDGIQYKDNLILRQAAIHTPWVAPAIESLSLEDCKLLFDPTPEIILLGHPTPNSRLSPIVLEYLYRKRIGVETMPVVSAIRTFNILLGESRNVVLGILWEES